MILQNPQTKYNDKARGDKQWVTYIIGAVLLYKKINL
ncbi:hypothetical protein BN990_02698 [Virgibacillus salexigens]|uniref:Uncharacterized protein n=1 Tax=Virgibacillus massiliensis TaxID=1462526 RepID=A0A024QEI9_9BACI|nr:hypothetical protein BN990_02696 [Virgibacillus massiliensis]CDQ40376.1 hypothetical protein BN990_02698 [Virgibacillus massiliensis]